MMEESDSVQSSVMIIFKCLKSEVHKLFTHLLGLLLLNSRKNLMKFQMQAFILNGGEEGLLALMYLSTAACAFVHRNGKNIKHTWFLADPGT